MSEHILEKLFEIICARKNESAENSYVASLYQKGTASIAAKVTEEANETVSEALQGDSGKLKQESADLLFHLMILWADQGIPPADVFSVLEQRFGTSGHTEKATRNKS
ncbi:MAG: phosphoribosyl-ATP diphosphatase [Alphaproteobacteria bacterium]